MTTGKILAKNTVFMFTGEVINKILSFVIILMVARMLGDYGLGLYSFAFALAGLMLTFSDFGLSILILKEIGREKKRARQYLASVMTIKVVLLIIMALAGIAAVSFFAKSPQTIKAVILLIIAMFFNFLTEPLKSVFVAFEKTAYYAAVVIIERAIAFALVAYVLMNGKGIVALMGVFIISYVLAFLLAFLLVFIKFTRFTLSFDLRKAVILVRKSLPFWFTLVFMVAYLRVDTLMLSWMTNFAVVGWYNAAYKLIEGLSFIPAVIVISIAFPVMSRYFVESRKMLRLLYKKVFYYLFMIIFPISIGTTMLADRLIALFFSGELTQNLVANAPIALKLLIWAEAFIFINYAVGYLLNAVDKQAIFTYTAGFFLLVNVILNYFFISAFSYVGAAVATIITQTGVFIILHYFSVKAGYGINLVEVTWKPVIAALVMTAPLYFLAQLPILILIPAAGSLYLSVLFFLRGFGTEEIELAKSFMRKSNQ